MYKHLLKMTDKNGIIQFSKKDEPDKSSGYTVDDNARALIVSLNMKNEEGRELSKIYANFLKEAQKEDGSFSNLKVDKKFLPDLDSEDCFGRAFLASCYVATHGDAELKNLGLNLILKSIEYIGNIRSLRAAAYCLIGLFYLEDIFPGNRFIMDSAKKLAYHLIEKYQQNSCGEWQWFEDRLTYCNALLPHSLFSYYELSSDKKALKVANKTLKFLSGALFKKGYLNIVGNRGWWNKEDKPPLFDQQPVDAASIILACLQAYIATGDKEYMVLARVAFKWYMGENINKVPLINDKTQGCHDALVPDGVNLNQGAEALVSYLMACQLLNEFERGNAVECVPAV
ncbi:hypothetical protein [Thermovenabulum gondwanense]|uniref:Glycosyltransferase n=1 Tax=Thermovenabulum gondwanense TaxID=520767 RepID=A0A162MLB3_9FIRM|nr:hypothetical protein [Thermovenabulum gondwanense]KYO66552.1 hypothetical protein ATZ99_11800 [Thermovenabulum gondwanense]